MPRLCWAPSPAVSSPAARRSEEEEEFGAGVLWTRQAAGEGALGTREEGRREQAEPRRGLGRSAKKRNDFLALVGK